MRWKSIHSGRIERWLGTEKAEYLSGQFRTWYGPPVNVIDLPGSVWIAPGGGFVGDFGFGGFYSAADSLRDILKRKTRQFLWNIDQASRQAQFGAGFTSLADAVLRASSGFSQTLNGNIQKTGPTGVVASASSLWRVGAMPAAGAAGSAAPGGRAPTKATTGAMAFTNPSSGTLHLTGADFSASVIANSVMLYDRIFDVAKTINSTATESVTGVPTRYQSSTSTNPDYAGGNFLFMEVGATQLANTAHNHSTCLYRNQANTDGVTLPSLAGNPGAVATIVDRFDMPVNTWFAPLATGDSGIMDLNQMQTSALVATGALNFVIGHPIGVMSFPVINSLLPFDWLTNRSLTPRIFDDACLAMFELPKPTTTACTYNGTIYATSAAA